ncbi:non-ribosomal peptide synthetase [Micromonospora chersina]|uniref:non-ribosomal peptide synthetase n=1 Tax=Micromonospora chersina TaxID=47854 RepID=UPI003720C8E9
MAERRPRVLPASPAQRRMYFASVMRPDSPAVVGGAVLTVAGDLTIERLERALAVLRGRHDALRAVFLEREGDVVQVVHEDDRRPVPITVVDAEGDTPAERRAWADAEARRLIGLPFDISSEPLWRVSVIRLSPAQHLLAFEFHHLIIDDISTQIFAADLRLAYADPNTPDLLTPAASYADVSAAETTDQAALDYWRRQLAGIQPARLPEDGAEHPAGPVGMRLPVVLPENAIAEFEAFCRQRSVTPFMGVLAVYIILLQRWSGVRDVAVGTQVLGRPHPDLFGTMGFFSNTVVLRCAAAPTLTFNQYLGLVRETVHDALDYQDVPFEAVVDALAPQRDADRNPLFQASIAYGTADQADTWKLPGLEVTPAPEPTEMAGPPFDLTLDVQRLSGHPTIAVEYDRRRFSDAAMRQFAEAYATLLDSLSRSPDVPIGSIPLLDPAALAQTAALGVGDDTRGDRDLAACASAWELFTRTVAAAPEREALVAKGERLTFAELADRARTLAAGLRSRGVRTGTVVGICLPRSTDLIVAMLATWCARGAFLLLDPQQPAGRRRLLVQEAGVALVVADESFTDVPTLSNAVLGAHATEPVEEDGVPRPGTAPAYVVFTSGSTGKPKGVVVDQAGLVALVATQLAPMYARLPEGRPVNIGGVNALTFDVFINHCLGMLAFGHRLLLLDDEERMDPLRILERGANPDTAIEVLDCSSSLMEILVEAGIMDLPYPPKILQIGGDRPSDRLWQRLYDEPGVLAFNAFGVTECTVESTMVEVHEYPQPVAGRAVGTTRVYIVDDQLQLQPPLFSGEICIGGLGVAQGYAGQPAYTSERFTADPFSPVPGQRMYRTGDKGRLRQDGQLEYQGRLDDQVKVRGLRIEPGEVEAALTAHSAIARAAVIATDSGTRMAQLVAYIVPADGQRDGLTSSAVREFLRGRLPSALLPDRVEVLDSLPVTPNGKLDRKALAAVRPSITERGARRAASAPAESREGRLCQIVAEVVGVPQAGLDDNFFDLGGNSLLAMQVATRVRTNLGCELSLRAIFDAQSIGHLAAQLAAADGRARPTLRRRRDS